jgi:hypothetical protein
MDEHERGHPLHHGAAQPRSQRHGAILGRRLSRLPVGVSLCAGLIVFAGGIAAAAVATRTASPPPTEYPSTARTVKGALPIEKLHRADECSKANDHPGQKPYFSLKGSVKVNTNPLVRGAQFTRRIDLVNKKGQPFHVYVSATTDRILTNFLATSRACFEYFTATTFPGPFVDPVRFDVLLVSAASSATQRTQAQLAAVRDALVAAGNPGSVNDIVTKLGGNSVSVVGSATAASSAALAAKVASGELTASEVSALNVTGIVAALAALPGAPFVTAAGDKPSSSAELAARLKTQKGGAVVVGAVPDKVKDKQIVIWFALDPTFSIGTGLLHSYVAQCRESAWVEVYSISGAERLRFWRQSPYYVNVGTRTASSANQDVKLAHSSKPYKRGYDTDVYGVSGGQYSIYGGYTWVRGTGGGCP